MKPGPLDLSADDFRGAAGRVVDEATRYLERLDDVPIRPSSTGAQTLQLFAGPVPETGLGATALDDLAAVAEHSRAGNGRFFGYVMGSGEPVGALGDLFASVINQNGTAWRSGPATAVIERTVVSWLAEAVGCTGFGGTLTSGGSLANLMGLAMAREAIAPANDTGRRRASCTHPPRCTCRSGRPSACWVWVATTFACFLLATTSGSLPMRSGGPSRRTGPLAWSHSLSSPVPARS